MDTENLTLKVSICTYTYNRASWLKETIASVLQQEGVEWEYLILNNGCTDNGATEAVLDEHRNDPRFRIFSVLKNGDPFEALWLKTKNDFITVLPDDDLLLGTDSLYRRAKMLSENENLGFVFSSVKGHDETDKDLGMLGMGNMASHDIPFGAASFERLFLDCFVPYPSGMYRKELAELSMASHVTSLGCSSDWGFWAAIAERMDQGYLASPTVSLRQHTKQDTHVTGIRQGGFLEAHLKLWEHYAKSGYHPTNSDWSRMLRTAHDLLEMQYPQDEERHRLLGETMYSFLPEGTFKNDPIVHLVMIVKDDDDSNESHIIERCLDSFKPLITGKVIMTFTHKQARNIGTSYVKARQWCLDNSIFFVDSHIIWEDFESARNYVLHDAEIFSERPSYFLIVDADDIFEGSKHCVFNEISNLDFYSFTIPIVCADGRITTQANVIRNIPGAWKYEGVIHETILFHGHPPRAKAINGTQIKTLQDGARSQNQNKWNDDIQTLRMAIEKYPKNSRYKFHLAENLYTSGQFEEAAKVFSNYLENDKISTDLRYVSLLMYGRICKRFPNDRSKAVESLLEAALLAPSRVEALGELAILFSDKGNFAQARIYALACVHANAPKFLTCLEPEWERWKGLAILADCELRLGFFGTAKEYLKILVSRKSDIPEKIFSWAEEMLNKFKATR
jgi:glycosyltransferase involved in cell wall biosynthesis